ncbi:MULTISPECIES: Rid family hydrolase [unclassified Sphingomonas]|uniref:Rid family hydrolase n=1 Tax=unclassified Sphingomonas TaxID=196159 RepID=UPI000BD95DB1|nr:MAG: hypothetical protein B7Z43_00190 [Sphingomonas sp. 12-62-6]OYX38598.1 MAG: hypothetical protein B7Y98_07920 [Sphingomonas sp. 32-62-10]OYY66759.1 MAG: hypothetical protein B7Y49_01950 [Sphingomonas sp. 28-62-11]
MPLEANVCPVSTKHMIQLHGFEELWGYVQAVHVGPFVFVSGTVSIDANGNPTAVDDMPTQVDNVYESIRQSLAAHGATLSHIVREAIVTTDLPRFLAEGAARRLAAFAGHSLPASAPWIEVPRLAQPEFMVEVEVTAYLPEFNPLSAAY